MKTLIIGLGNPILGDDGVGWKVADLVKGHLDSGAILRLPYWRSGSKQVDYLNSVEVDFLSLGGLSLMERMIGYQYVVIVDSMETGLRPVGSVTVFPLESLPDPQAGHSASAHDATLMTALRTAEKLGAEIPKIVDIVAIEAVNVYDFGEELTPAVAAAVPLAAAKTLELINTQVVS